MGQLHTNFFSKEWIVYQRMTETDRYDSEPIQKWAGTSEEDALACFKHEMYAYGLNKYEYSGAVKAIYLYHGSSRVAKITRVHNNQLNIWSTKIRCFIDQHEKLAKQRYPLLQKTFFKQHHKDYSWIDAQTISYVKKNSKQITITE